MVKEFKKDSWYKRIEDKDFKWGSNFVLYIKVYDYRANSQNPVKDCESITYSGKYMKSFSERDEKGWELLTDLTEIAQYLPKNHPDIVKVSVLDSFQIW